ncbi:hypothetical protein LCGC14_2707270, partial [marine sediment metagenome]
GLERPASNAVRALANTFVSGSGVAGSDNTAQTVKTVVVPANTLIAVNCRLRVRVYWRGDTGGAVTCTVTVNGVTIATSTDVETDRVKREFAKAKEDFPDFMEWKDEMRDIITAHPELSAENIYLLARAKNPEKVKEIDKKAKEEKGEKEEIDESGKLKGMRAFGGLTPTSGASVENDGKKQPKEAALSAWDQAMSNVPDSLVGGQS